MAKEVMWSTIVAEWPMKAFHHLVDTQPEGNEKPWQELCSISDIPLDQWYANIPAEEILRRVKKPAMAIWWAQRFSSEQLKEMRPDETKIMVLTCIDTMVYYVWGTLRNLMMDRNLFCYQQLAFLDMVLGRASKIACVVETKVERIVEPVFCVAVGPRDMDIRSFKGDIHASYETIGTKDKIYMLSKRPSKGAPVAIEVPKSVKLAWLRRTFVVAQKQDYLTQVYYQASMEQYSSWSFELHQKQVAQLLENLPTDSQIIAPGDGIGVVAKQWKGEKPVIAGDLVSTPWSEGVVQESFMDTMNRGLSGDVLILSYVLSMMNEEEKRCVSMWRGPVMVIEPKDHMILQGFEHVGPGVWIKDVPRIYRPVVSVSEGPARTYGVAYSENLLTLPEISCLTDNIAVQYWKSMRPQGKVVVWTKGEVIPLVIATLPEYFFYKSRIQGSIVYLAAIGKFWDGGAEEFLMDAVNTITTRRVYKISRPQLRVKSSLKRFVSYYEDFDRFYFCCPMVKSFVINFPGVQASFDALEKEVKPSQAIWLGKNARGYYIEVPGGILIVPDTQESRCLLSVYAEYVRLRGYYDNIALFESSWKKKMRELRTRIEKARERGQAFDPGKSPAEWVRMEEWDNWVFSERSFSI